MKIQSRIDVETLTFSLVFDFCVSDNLDQNMWKNLSAKMMLLMEIGGHIKRLFQPQTWFICVKPMIFMSFRYDYASNFLFFVLSFWMFVVRLEWKKDDTKYMMILSQRINVFCLCPQESLEHMSIIHVILTFAEVIQRTDDAHRSVDLPLAVPFCTSFCWR